MELEHDSGVIDTTIAGTRVLRPRVASATVLFGLGPALAGSPEPQRRLELVLAELSPALRAVRWVRQVHGRTLSWVAGEHPEPVRCVGDADGLLTSTEGVGVVVWTADCVPVALVGRRAVAMVHAGWRGVAAGIAADAVRRLVHDTGSSPATLSAYLGPAVSGRHYPVGPEVIDALAGTGVPEPSWRDGNLVDLRGFLGAQLAQLRVGRIVTVGPCTFSTPSLASFRRDGSAAGRQWSLVWR